MATVRTPNSFSIGVGNVPDSVSIPQADRATIGIVHEIGSDLLGGTIRKELLVHPSDRPTIVSVDSQVVSTAARQMNSPAYLASIRRRKTKKIETMFSPLAKKAHQDDFEAFTFRIVEEIRELLIQLADVQQEGNSREILRQVRDTFLDGGSDRYRDPKARDLVASILHRLAEADELTSDDVDQVWDELFDNGLSAQLPALFVVGEGDEERDS